MVSIELFLLLLLHHTVSHFVHTWFLCLQDIFNSLHSLWVHLIDSLNFLSVLEDNSSGKLLDLEVIFRRGELIDVQAVCVCRVGESFRVPVSPCQVS